jgi:hypothetical protein
MAMTAVRIGVRVVPGKLTDHSKLRPPTDVMAITSLPPTPAHHPVSGFPLSDSSEASIQSSILAILHLCSFKLWV